MLKYLKWWIMILLAAVTIVYLVPNDISVAVNERLDRKQVEKIADSFLEGLGYKTKDYFTTITRDPGSFVLAYLNSEMEKARFIRIVNSDSIPNIHWQVRYVQNIPRDQPQTSYYVWITPRGKIVGFERNLPDTLTIASLSEEEAAKKAQLFLTDQVDISLNNFILRKSQQFRQTSRTDYTFTWEKQTRFAAGKIVLRVFIQGDEIGGYDYNFHFPESITQEISEQTTRGTLIYLIQLILLAILFIFTLVLFLKKYHEGEVSTQLGITLFLIVFVLGLLRSINEFPVAGITVSIGNMSASNIQLIVFVYEVLLKNVFLGILLLTSWAVGEAYARSYWPEKLNAIDSLLNKKFFTESTGIALLRGGAIGFITAMIYLAVISIFTGRGKDIIQVILPFGNTFQYYIPAVSVVIIAVMMALIAEVFFRFFIINVIYHRWRNKWLAVVSAALLWPIGYTILMDYPVFSSMSLNIGLSILMGLVFGWLYFKYDLLTLIAGTASTTLILGSLPLFASKADWHQISLYGLFVIFLVPAAQIIISAVKKETFQYSYKGLPKHILRITERERMQKELEIARNVQMGLLPKQNPTIRGFDISGTCLPAKEVGGDYFDFVTLGPNKLGIAIGDVSGKGVPAAIYMTLTKGILQSHADETISPRLVLNKVNKLLYRNIEKNSFVSMFYAVLDSEAKELTFARAGHNPGIIINQNDGSNQELRTDGIALGLEEGSVFNRTLKEQSIRLIPGDTLVFYTDGFTEAMNRFKEEFGEERFIQLISENRHLHAQELIDTIVSQIRSFSRNVAQHDDMTMVVVKIL